MMLRTMAVSALILGLLGGLGGCARSSTAMNTHGGDPGQMHSAIMVADNKCDNVVASVRNKLRRDSGLGLDGELASINETRFVLPRRENKERRWQATVTVTCFPRDPSSSRISVEVEAQRKKPDGSWRNDPDTSDLIRKVTDALYPLP